MNARNIKILNNSLVTSYNFTNHLIALEDKFAGKKLNSEKSELTLHKIRTTHTILANGHIERFISFRNNDLPGVMLASSFEKYIHRYGVVPDTNPVIFTNNSTTISLLKSLISLGHKPAAYIDARDEDEIELNGAKMSLPELYANMTEVLDKLHKGFLSFVFRSNCFDEDKKILYSVADDLSIEFMQMKELEN